MKINILLPYKEKFDLNKASSVSITIKNNLFHTRFLKDIKIFGRDVEKPLFRDNFVGIKYSYLSLKSKNNFLASEMLKVISREKDSNQLIEIHNRPYLINQIEKEIKIPISLFCHNDPQTMRGSKSIKDRENILKKWSEIGSSYRFMHDRAYLHFEKQNFRFALPVIVLSTVTGTANFAQGSFPSAWLAYVPLFIGFLNLTAGLITTIAQFISKCESLGLYETRPDKYCS